MDKATVAKAFDRGDFDPLGDIDDPKVFRTPKFWLGELEQATEESIKARAVRALGLCGDQTYLPKLTGLKSSTNSYLLAELAKAFYRLGDHEQYLSTLESLVALPVKDNIYYQTLAVDYLLQTHPAKARPAWERIEKELAQLPDLQPTWVYAHVLQGERRP